MATAKAGLRRSYHLTIAVFQVSRAACLACLTTSFLAPEIRTHISHYTRDKGFFRTLPCGADSPGARGTASGLTVALSYSTEFRARIGRWFSNYLGAVRVHPGRLVDAQFPQMCCNAPSRCGGNRHGVPG